MTYPETFENCTKSLCSLTTVVPNDVNRKKSNQLKYRMKNSLSMFFFISRHKKKLDLCYVERKGEKLCL